MRSADRIQGPTAASSVNTSSQKEAALNSPDRSRRGLKLHRAHAKSSPKSDVASGFSAPTNVLAVF